MYRRSSTSSAVQGLMGTSRLGEPDVSAKSKLPFKCVQSLEWTFAKSNLCYESPKLYECRHDGCKYIR